MLFEKCVGDDLDAAQAVVEDDERVREHEQGVGDAERVGRGVSKGGLKLADGIVGEVADHAAGEGRKGGVWHGFERSHLALKGGEDVVGCGECAGFVSFRDGDVFPIRGEDPLRAGADDGPAPALVGGFGGFEEEGVLGIAQLEVGGERRLEIGGKLGEHGHDVSLLGKGGECFEGRFYWDQGHAGRMGENFKL